jgi:hypothetical protein
MVRLDTPQGLKPQVIPGTNRSAEALRHPKAMYDLRGTGLAAPPEGLQRGRACGSLRWAGQPRWLSLREPCR